MELSIATGESTDSDNCFRKDRWHLVKMKTHILCKPTIPLLDVFSRDDTHA